jgi:hypothetical protein
MYLACLSSQQVLEQSQVRMTGRTSHIINSVDRNTLSFPRNCKFIKKFPKPEQRNVYAGSLLHSARFWVSVTCFVLLMLGLSKQPQYWARFITSCVDMMCTYVRTEQNVLGKFRLPFYLRTTKKVFTRAVRKVSSHFGFLENHSRGLGVTWQPVRRDLTGCP